MSRFPEYLSQEKKDELRKTAQAIIASGKGILAADESTGEYCVIQKIFHVL
jgi:fructose-bisphosphate aldolase class 1